VADWAAVMDDDGVVSIAILAGLVADRILAQQTTAANRINKQTSYWQWQVTQQRIKYIAGPVTDATLNSMRSQTCSQWGSRNTGDRLLHVLTFRGLSVSVCWRVIRTKTTKPTERPLGGRVGTRNHTYTLVPLGDNDGSTDLPMPYGLALPLL